MATTTVTPVTNNAANLTEKTVCLNVSFGFLGNHRKLSTAQFEVDADKALIRASKTLFDCPELKAIDKHDGHFKGWLRERCLPSLFRNGIYLVPLGSIAQVEERLKDHQTKRAALVEAFVGVYQQEKDKSMERLAGVANPGDYQSITRVRAAFSFEWQYVSFSTPGKLKEISAGFFQAEQEKAAAKWQQATAEITLILRENLKELVDHLIDRLTPEADGKRKHFHSATIKNVREFLEGFDIKNVTDDAQLAKIVEKAKDLMAGVDPDKLRKSEDDKQMLAASFGQIKQQLDLLVVEAGTRSISLEDEE